MIPQSFIGVDKDGYLTICLQTNTKATYKGYAYMLKKITEMYASATTLVFQGPPYHYTQIGFPFPDGSWVETKGYWNGYQFEYEDISDKIMGAQPEVFIIGGAPAGFDLTGGPRVNDGAWHHLLFSFDISGPVHSEQPSAPPPNPDGSSGGPTPPPIITTRCKAWLAVDDKNYTDMALQRKPLVHDGFMAPLLPGVGTDVIGHGPTTSYGRQQLSLGPNDILPLNAWLHGFIGNPKDALLQFASNTPIQEVGNAFVPKGNFNALAWAGSLWPQYGNGVAPGDWLPVLVPPRPTVPDPKTLDVPTYDCPKFNLPVQGFPIGIPASTHHIQHNTGVEMAEFQIWANRTLDTGDVSKRRLFIDSKGKPVPPRKAADVLGKPDILLHGTGNWKNGRNTGSTGVNNDGSIKDSGQFDHIARIEKYLPDPQLNK
jgi:hypothetical protein